MTDYPADGRAPDDEGIGTRPSLYGCTIRSGVRAPTTGTHPKPEGSDT